VAVPRILRRGGRTDKANPRRTCASKAGKDGSAMFTPLRLRPYVLYLRYVNILFILWRRNKKKSPLKKRRSTQKILIIEKIKRKIKNKVLPRSSGRGTARWRSGYHGVVRKEQRDEVSRSFEAWRMCWFLCICLSIFLGGGLMAWRRDEYLDGSDWLVRRGGSVSTAKWKWRKGRDRK
jgi:hypothetical protein